MKSGAVWACSSCGKPKQLAGAHLAGKTAVNSDCWPCGRKRVFQRAQAAPNGGAAAPVADGGAGSMPRALSHEEESARAAAVTTVSPRTAPTADSAQFPGDAGRSSSPDEPSAASAGVSAAAARFAAWASSKVGLVGSAPPPRPLGGSSSAPSGPSVVTGNAGGAFHKAAPADAQTPPHGAARPSTGAGPFGALSSADGSNDARGRAMRASFGTAGGTASPNEGRMPPFRLPSPAATGRSPHDGAATGGSHSRTVLGSLLAGGAGGGGGGHSTGASPTQQGPASERPRWLCTRCGKEKALAGPHLAGKSSVRSDCWPCGLKRTFELVCGQPGGAAACAQPDASGSRGHSRQPSFGDRASGGEASGEDADRVLGASPVTFASATIDLMGVLRWLFAHTHAHTAAGLGPAASAVPTLRVCPPPASAAQLPLLQLLEQGALGTGATFECPLATHLSPTIAGQAPPQPTQGFGSPGAVVDTRETLAARNRQLERLACLAARIGPALSAAAAKLAGSQPTAGDGPLRVGVFCNSHDELAAVAAYLALAELPTTAAAAGDTSAERRSGGIVFEAFGPPPEYTTNRTVASDLIAAVRDVAPGPAARVFVTAPVTHGDRHKAVKYIAKRAGGLLISPAGAVGFAIADRAHLAWQAQGQAAPAHSLVVLGRPARWGEIEKILRVVDALKIQDGVPASPVRHGVDPNESF